MKNTLIKKIVLLNMVGAFLLPAFSLQAVYRDIDIMKSKKPDLRVLASQLRDEILYLKKENKRLEDTIEPRSYQKGKNSVLLIGAMGATVVGLVANYIGYNMNSSSRRFR